jgi:hypothetical protein
MHQENSTVFEAFLIQSNFIIYYLIEDHSPGLKKKGFLEETEQHKYPLTQVTKI